MLRPRWQAPARREAAGNGAMDAPIDLGPVTMQKRKTLAAQGDVVADRRERVADRVLHEQLAVDHLANEAVAAQQLIDGLGGRPAEARHPQRGRERLLPVTGVGVEVVVFKR